MKKQNLENKSIETDSNSKLEGDTIVDTKNDDIANGVDSTLKTAANQVPSGMKTVDTPKAVVNTSKAGEAVAAGSGSSSGMSSVGLANGGILFSGGAGQVGEDLGATSQSTTSYRSGNRAGKRSDSITRKVDFLNAEIIKTSVKESKPLSETDAKQGYAGNYQNEHAITQKTNGGVPGDLLFNRSADLISMDMLYYPEGQFNTRQQSTPSIHILRDPTVSTTDYIDVPFGNFVHRSLQLTLSHTTQSIVNMTFDVDDITPSGLDERTLRAAGDAYVRTVNRNELDRLAMVQKAGNESDPSWSCLGDVIVNATAQNMLLRQIDACAGDMVYLSHWKLNTALAYQLNKTSKDGRRVTGPMAEMTNQYIEGIYSSVQESISEADGVNFAINRREAISKGSPAMWLRMMDSVTKYNTKGKLLSLPLSFKNALPIAQANASPLVMHSELRNLLQTQEMFSTIDKPYDPFLPICVTDGAALALPINYNSLFHISNGEYVSDLQTMTYENIRNRYKISILDHFTKGIYDWFAERLCSIYRMIAENRMQGNWEVDANQDYVFNIPIVSGTLGISLWDLIVLSAVPNMVDDRIAPFTEVIKYEKNFGYPYSGLEHVTLDVTPRNFSFSGPEAPLTAGMATGAAALRVQFPELFWPKTVRHLNNISETVLVGKPDGVVVDVVLPFYFNQQQFENVDGVINNSLLLSDDFATMSYPSTRSGSTLAQVDSIYSMSEEGFRSALDRMVVYPAYDGTYYYQQEHQHKRPVTISGGITSYYDSFTYKYGLTSDGIPVVQYIGYMDNADKASFSLTITDILRTPRELGYVQVAPAGYITPIATKAGDVNYRAGDSSYFGLSGPGFKFTSYKVMEIGDEPAHEILQAGETDISIGADLRQVYNTYFANADGMNMDEGWIISSAPMFAINSSGNITTQDNVTTYTPFVDGSYDGIEYDPVTATYSGGETQTTQGLQTISLQKYFWGRLQRLPFVINPFDTNAYDITSVTSSSRININNLDIYDTMYFFGFCGTRASDYSELIDIRVKSRIGQGMNYISDPFKESSILLK